MKCLDFLDKKIAALRFDIERDCKAQQLNLLLEVREAFAQDVKNLESAADQLSEFIFDSLVVDYSERTRRTRYAARNHATSR